MACQTVLVVNVCVCVCVWRVDTVCVVSLSSEGGCEGDKRLDVLRVSEGNIWVSDEGDEGA